MKNIVVITAVSFILFGAFALFASESELRWGGRGYDPELKKENYSSRFIVRPHFKDAGLIDMAVDSKETVKETGQIDLVSGDGIVVSSSQCFKAMHHISAPWACSFKKEDLPELAGQGKIRVKDKSGRIILEDKIDFEALNNFIKELAASYTACGCGCCQDTEPIQECLYHSKGDDLNKIIEADKNLSQSPQCAVMGCSRPVKYIYCD